MKKCTVCGVVKTIDCYHKEKKKKDGHKNICKDCVNKQSEKYKKSKEGVSKVIYGDQIKSSKRRGHSLPTYSSKWLQEWMFNNPEFHRLYDIWVISGYKKMMKPSIDRIDDNIGYTEYNIQLTTWAENKRKGHKSVRSGEIYSPKYKSVIQYSLDGEEIARYKTIMIAERMTGIHHPNISKVCIGKRKTAGGYIWKYDRKK